MHMRHALVHILIGVCFLTSMVSGGGLVVTVCLMDGSVHLKSGVNEACASCASRGEPAANDGCCCNPSTEGPTFRSSTKCCVDYRVGAPVVVARVEMQVPPLALAGEIFHVMASRTPCSPASREATPLRPPSRGSPIPLPLLI